MEPTGTPDLEIPNHLLDVPWQTDEDAPPPPEPAGPPTTQPSLPATQPVLAMDRQRARVPCDTPLTKAALSGALLQHFGLEEFRPGQHEVVSHVLGGMDAVVVMPTGAGKSLCYQLPAMLLPGLTIVVSPLIALMKDQVDNLRQRGIPATFINSSVAYGERRSRMQAIGRGDIKLVFVAPERFRSRQFAELLSQVDVDLLAIDEAHCVSSWGHDFRPDYLDLGRVRRALGSPRTLALTATATPKVRDDIIRLLQMDRPSTFISGFERNNLFLEVYKASSRKEKLARIDALLRHTGGTSIVYAMSRRNVMSVYEALVERGMDAGFYHGGMRDNQRREVHQKFMNGDLKVLVATNAFGMGVDKADIRSIVHYQMPATIEAYYQEAGRAGRDQKPAHCLFLYNYADRRICDYFVDSAHPPRGVVEDLWDVLLQSDSRHVDVQPRWLAKKLKTNEGAINSALSLLDRAGHVRLGYGTGVERLDCVSAKRLGVDWRDLRTRRDREIDKLKQVIFYATNKTCRSRFILEYFGSKVSSANCGHCDVCSPTPPYASNWVAPRKRPSRADKKRQQAKKLSKRAALAKKLEVPPQTIRVLDSTITVVRKVTACVARCRSEESQDVVVRVLAGALSGDILDRELDQLSTFGLLRYLEVRELTALLNALVDVGFLVRVGTNGHVRLTADAVAVMKGDAELPERVARRLAELLIPAESEATSVGRVDRVG